MARSSTVHVCASCGHEEPRWHGRCPGGAEWNTLVEEPRGRAAPARGGGRGPGPAGRGGPCRRGARVPGAVALGDVSAPGIPRLASGIGELDRVLGGGIVPGSVVLIGGAPGIGKSTLTNMVLGNLAEAGHRTLYVSGEGSPAPIALRAQ